MLLRMLDLTWLSAQNLTRNVDIFAGRILGMDHLSLS